MLVESEDGVNNNTETVDVGKCNHFGLDYNWNN
jgi:hypothetical protein